jgi:Tfp pilus assembly protein PilF
LNERLAAMYAALGETWLKKGDKDQAAACLEKAIRAAPASLTAREAQARLTSLSGKPPAIPTQYQKPEK